MKKRGVKYAYSIRTKRVRETDFPYSGEPISSPEAAKEFFSTLDGFDVEHFAVAYLDTKNKVTAIQLSKGTIDQTAVYPREIVKHALLSGAASVIVAHNHPSGDNTPSGADRALTVTLKNALELIQIKLHDHFIIGTPQDIYSFAEMGQL